MNRKYIAYGVAAAVALIAIFTALKCAVSVPAGHVAVVTKFGQVDPEPLPPGLHFINPLKSTVDISTRLQAHKSKANAATSKVQAVTAEITVTYWVEPSSVPEIYGRIGNLTAINAAIFDANVQQALKSVTGGYLAEELIQKRAEVKARVERSLVHQIELALEEKGLKGAIHVGNIAITDFDFSKEFNAGVDAKVEAEQRALQAESERDQKSTIAQATSDAAKKRADATAYAIEVKSKARAEGIKVQAEALANAQGLLELRRAERWDGEVPEFHSGGAIPFINLDPQAPVK
jgi:regulator of protease activity HflC (stomatin/prohibitin superfamily)